MLPFNQNGSWRFFPTLGFTDGVGPDLLTVAGSANAKRTWKKLTGTLTESASGLWVQPTVTVTGDNSYSALVDIGIGLGGVAPTRTILSNLLVSIATTGFKTDPFPLPIAVAASNNLWGRVQINTANTPNINLSINPYKSGLQGGEGLSRVATIGATTGSSNGTSVTPGSTINTPGNWTDLATTHVNGILINPGVVPFDTKFILWAFGNAGDYSENSVSYLYELAVKGPDGNRYTKYWAVVRGNTLPHTPAPSLVWGPVNIPRGYTLSVRAQPLASSSVDNMDTVVYCVG